MRDLAARCGVDHSSLYRHFDGRDGLISELRAFSFSELTDEIERKAPSSLSQLLVVYLNYALDSLPRYHLMFSGPLVGDDLQPDLAKEISSLIVAAERRTRSCEPSARRDEVVRSWAMVHGLLDLWRRGALNVSDEVALRDYALSALKSLDQSLEQESQ